MSGMVDELNADRQCSASLHRARRAGRCECADRRRFAAPNARGCRIAWAVSIADYVPYPAARGEKRDPSDETPAETAIDRATLRRRRTSHLDDFPVVPCRRRVGPWRLVGAHPLKSSFAQIRMGSHQWSIANHEALRPTWHRRTCNRVPPPPRRSHDDQSLERAFEQITAATVRRHIVYDWAEAAAAGELVVVSTPPRGQPSRTRLAGAGQRGVDTISYIPRRDASGLARLAVPAGDRATSTPRCTPTFGGVDGDSARPLPLRSGGRGLRRVGYRHGRRRETRCVHPRTHDRQVRAARRPPGLRRQAVDGRRKQRGGWLAEATAGPTVHVPAQVWSRLLQRLQIGNRLLCARRL
jgi:hypothetical protein